MQPGFVAYLVVFIGGGIGAALRHGANRLALAWNTDFPFHTLFVNVLGCFLMGALASWFAFRGEDSSQHVRLLLTTGLLGGFTTFSAFSLDAAYLWQRGQVGSAALYCLTSVGGSLLAVFVGIALVRAVIS
ncbi:MAG: fluoride efflux transporter CrcB [Rickettsiales bacterium]